MDQFRQDFTSTEKPTSPFHVNKENEFSEEFSHKLKISDKKRLPFAKNKTSVKKSKTLDVEDQPGLSRSFSFDENVTRFDSSLPPYDPVDNYLSPRPKFLMYNPERRQKMLFRQEMMNGIRKSASCGDRMLVSDEEEETESSVEFYLDASSGDECMVDNIEMNDDSVSSISSSEDENMEEVEEYSGWSLSVFLKYLFVMIVLILTTLSISSMNSPVISPAKELYRVIGVSFPEVGSKPFDSMILVAGKLSPRKIYNDLDNKDFVVQNDGLVELQHQQTKDVCEDEIAELETAETKDEMWLKYDFDRFQSGQIDESEEIQVKEIEQEEISYPLPEPAIPISKEIESNEIEGQKEVYSQFSGDDSNQNEVSVESRVETEIESTGSTDNHKKSAKFGYSAGIVVFALILVTSSVVYYSIVVRKKTAVPEMEYVNRGEVIGSYKTFGSTGSVFSESQQSNFYQRRMKNNMSPTKTDSSSSSFKNSSRFGMSTGDSPSHGSFSVEKMIIKKKKSQTPEVIISTVRRSSRINNRSFSSP